MGAYNVFSKPTTRSSTAKWKESCVFNITGPVAWFEVNIEAILTESGGADGTITGLVSNGLETVVVKVGSAVLYTVYGGEETDYSTGHGCLGEINRFLFGYSFYQTGYTLTKSTTTTVSGCFKLPFWQPDAANKAITVEINMRAVADYTATGTMAYTSDQIDIEAYYVSSCPKLYYQTLEKTGIVATTEQNLSIDNAEQYKAFAIVFAYTQSSAYEDHITRIKLTDQGGQNHGEWTRNGTVKDAVEHGGFIAQSSAAARVWAEKNEGCYACKVPQPVQIQNLKMKITPNSSASAGIIHGILFGVSGGAPVMGRPSVQPASSTPEPAKSK
jgi:hypothetical protein